MGISELVNFGQFVVLTDAEHEFKCEEQEDKVKIRPGQFFFFLTEARGRLMNFAK